MGEHARLSFSAAERWLRCPASVNMTKDLRESEASEAAKEGTIAHAWLEKSLNNWVITGDTTIICDDPEMGDHLQKCMDYVLQRYDEIPGGNKKIEFEVRVDLHYMSNRDDMWGTGDVIISTDMYIDVIDLKYGRGIFVQSDTPQNRLYGLAKMAMFMKESKGDVPWTSIRSTIMQPRFPDKDGEIFRYEDFYPDALMTWFEEEVMVKAGQTDEPGKPVAGTKQCQWCLAKPTCPAAESKAKALMPFEPAPGQALAVGDAPDELDIDRLIGIHDNIPFISGYLKSVTGRIHDLLKTRDSRLSGRLKLVVSQRASMWDGDADEIVLELVKGRGKIPKRELVKESVITAAQALKLSKLKPAQKARLKERIKKGEGSLAIVPFSDPRADAFPVDLPFEKVASTQPSEKFDFL